MLKQNLIGNDITAVTLSSGRIRCVSVAVAVVTDVSVTARERQGAWCGDGGSIKYQPSTPGFYDFEVLTGLERYDFIRFYKHVCDWVVDFLICSVVNKQGIICYGSLCRKIVIK